LTAGLSAGGAEAAAPKLAKYLYGKDAKDLTAEEKSTISAITGLVASGVGATTGDVSNTVQSGKVAQNAVEEDNLFGVLMADKKIDKQKNNYYFQALQACTPVIVRIDDKSRDFLYFVVVDGVTVRNGQKVLAIRDPHGKSYFSPLETFKNAFTGEAIIPRNFK